MSDTPVSYLDPEALRALAAGHPGTRCPACLAIHAPGWEALPGGFDASGLRRVGTLRHPDVEDPTLEEYHPDGTHAWSDTAPIAPTFFPYNRCDVWQCAACARPFLRYTEYGGYYVEQRIRELAADKVVDA